MKNILVVTGGAGFVGSNLIKTLIKKTKYNIISLDNYSTGSKKNHIIPLYNRCKHNNFFLKHKILNEKRSNKIKFA